jgi:hypothetical protein
VALTFTTQQMPREQDHGGKAGQSGPAGGVSR